MYFRKAKSSEFKRAVCGTAMRGFRLIVCDANYIKLIAFF